jgi:hypothetical protein
MVTFIACPFMALTDHAITYMRMLDANSEGADWREVSRIVLHIDPEREPDRAKRAYESHLARAKWMTKTGYRLLLRSGFPEAWPKLRDRHMKARGQQTHRTGENQ